MSFASPGLLLVLLLVPAGVALYWRGERRRRRAAEAWAAPAVMPSVVPRAPGWRRHAPVARVGAVAFDDQARAVETPTTDRAAVREALREALVPSGGTATGDALSTSLGLLRGQAGPGGKRPPAAIVLLTDGASTHGRDPLPVAGEARRLGIPVHPVALGTPGGTIAVPDGRGGTRDQPVPPDVDALREIAERSGGEAFTATDAGALSAVYERLGSDVATREEEREVTAVFAGGAVLLLLSGGLLSLRWFRRLV